MRPSRRGRGRPSKRGSGRGRGGGAVGRGRGALGSLRGRISAADQQRVQTAGREVHSASGESLVCWLGSHSPHLSRESETPLCELRGPESARLTEQ